MELFWGCTGGIVFPINGKFLSTAASVWGFSNIWNGRTAKLCGKFCSGFTLKPTKTEVRPPEKPDHAFYQLSYCHLVTVKKRNGFFLTKSLQVYVIR